MTIRLEWLGVDGSVWDLRDGPVRLGAGGTGGLGFTPLQTFTRQSAVLDGQVATGWRAQARDLTLPILKSRPGWSTRSWADVDRAWWKACQPHKAGAFRVTAWDGQQRTLPARVTDDGYSMDFDPSDMNTDDTVMTWTADAPWWLGQPVTTSFVPPITGDFLRGGFAPPFTISSGSVTGSQTVANAGDLDAWPVWTIAGPVSSFSLTVGAATVAGTIALLAGQSLTISTDPGTGQTATRETGANVTRQLSQWGFAPIPAAASTVVAVTVAGGGSASLSLTPRYFRAW